MSWLSKITGVHISPHGVSIEPLKALGTVATLGSMGALGPVAGALEAIPGAGAVMGGLSKVGGALSSIPGAGAIESGVSKLGGVSGMANTAGGFLKNHGDQLLGAGSAYQGYKDSQKSNDLMNQALGIANQSYADRAPLRTAGVQGMVNNKAPDLSSVFASGNPYSKIRSTA